MTPFTIVAHRGFAGNYPENTLAAMKAALAQGVHHLELDIQLTRDRVPVLLHDATLDRTTSGKGSVFEKDWADLTSLNAGEPKRFQQRFYHEPIASLDDFLTWLAFEKRLHAFVEIKDESLDQFGYDSVIEQVLPRLLKHRDQITVIAYDLEFLLEMRRRGWQGVGWVLTFFNEEEHHLASEHQPEIIICNFRKMIAKEYWQGPWQWMHYEIVDAAHARELVKRGAAFIETMEVEKLCKDLEPGEWE